MYLTEDFIPSWMYIQRMTATVRNVQAHRQSVPTSFPQELWCWVLFRWDSSADPAITVYLNTFKCVNHHKLCALATCDQSEKFLSCSWNCIELAWTKQTVKYIFNMYLWWSDSNGLSTVILTWRASCTLHGTSFMLQLAPCMPHVFCISACVYRNHTPWSFAQSLQLSLSLLFPFCLQLPVFVLKLIVLVCHWLS